MQPIIHGIELGIFLSLLFGPLWIALIEATIQQKMVGGFVLASGIWISDVLFIIAVYQALPLVESITSWPHFTTTLGSLGGLTLMILGFVSLKRTSQRLTTEHATSQTFPALWTKGFLLNTINPFTFFFWSLLMSTVVVDNDYSQHESKVLFITLLFMIMLTDSIKILAAGKVANHWEFLQSKVFQQLTGAAFILCGIILIIRVFS